MSQFLLEARYTGEGPLSGEWLLAAEVHGFLVLDKHRTEEAAKKELARLAETDWRFVRSPTDWELRVVPDLRRTSVPAPELQPAISKPEIEDWLAEDEPVLTPKRGRKKKG